MASSTAIDFLVGKGWTKEQAAGIAANLQHESNFKVGAVGDGGKAYGIAQWHPNRQTDFQEYAGKPIQGSSLEDQLGFVHHELTKGKERSAGNKLRLSTTAQEAGDIVSRFYERPFKTNEEASKRGATAAGLLGQKVTPTVSKRMARGLSEDGEVIDRSRPVEELRKGGNIAMPEQGTGDGTGRPGGAISPTGLGDNTVVPAGVAEAEARSRAEQEAKDAQPFWGSLYEKNSTIGATYQNTIAPEIRLMANLINGFPEADPEHTAYMRDNYAKETADYNDRERERIMGSTSAEDLAQQKFTISEERENAEVIGRASTGGQLAAGLLSGLMSPTAIATAAVTAGAFGALGVGSRAAIAAGRPTKAILSTASEGAIGNVAYEAALMAMGEQRSANDFLIAATVGFGLGAALGVPAYREATRVRAAELAQEAARHKATLIANAIRELGEGATPNALALHAARAESAAIRSHVAEQRAVPREDALSVDPAAEVARIKEAEAREAELAKTRAAEVEAEGGVATAVEAAEMAVPGATPPVPRERTRVQQPDESTRPTRPEHQALWENGILLEVDTVADIARFSPSVSSRGTAVDPKAKAIYVPSDDRVYLVRENMTAAERANPQGLIAHEVGVHYGLERSVGVEKFRKIVMDIENSAHPDAVAARNAVPENTPAYLRGEEMLGYLAEKANSTSVGKLVAAIRNFLRDNVKVFKDLTVTRDDALAYIRGSVKRARKSRISQDGTFPYVWHGSPVKGIDELKLAYAGSGEGNAAFGHGHYVTAERSTGLDYRNKESSKRGMAPEEGGLYRAKLEGKQEDYFDWDNPLPPSFTDRFDFATEGMTGKEFYTAATKEYGSQVAASQALADQGVRGLRYATGKTRGKATVNSNYVVFSDSSVKMDVRYSFGTELAPKSTPEEKAMLKLVEDVIDNAVAWNAAHPTDPVKLKSLTNAAGQYLATPGQLLATSEHPVARWVAGTIAEHTMGASGRRSTASIRSKMLNEGFTGNAARNFEGLYDVWKSETYGRAKGFVSDITDLKAYTEFNTQVMSLMESRLQGYPIQAHPRVVDAADALEAAYTRMLHAQKAAKTTGWAVLPADSVGYVPHSLDAAKIRDATPAQLMAYKNLIANQLETISLFDKDFADKVARAYLDHARVNAHGGHEIPANVYDPAASGYVRSSLKAIGLTEAEVLAFESKLASGGASHTKKRLKLDLNETTTLPDGTVLRLGDLFKTDMVMLLKNQSRRVAGEVALAEQGIMGSAGMAVIERALQFGDSTKGTILTPDQTQAFHQITAEILGRPYGDAMPKGLDELVTATAQAKLGGMGITQAMETTQIGLGLGFSHMANFVGDMPRLVSEVKTLAKGGKVDNPVLGSIELYGGQGEFGLQGYKMVTAYDNPNSVNDMVGRSAASPVARLLRKTGQAFRVASLHRIIEAVQRRGVAEQITIKALRAIRDGNADARLADMGFTPDIIARLRNDLPNAVVWNGDKVKEFDIRKFKDVDAGQAFAVAIRRGSGQLIQEAFPGEVGSWQHHTIGKVMSQFRNYPILAMEKQWGRTVAINGGGLQGAAVATAMMVAAAGIALPMHFARIQLNALGRDDREEYIERMLEPTMLAKSVLNYVALSGMLPDFIAASKAAADVATGEKSSGKSTLGTFIPSAGYVEDILGAMQDPTDPKKWSRILPLGNTPAIGPLFNLWAAD